MNLFGKILVVFNILAAIAFFVIGAMDYSQRSQWSYSHFRHQIALHGLPVANEDNTWRLPGRSVSSDLTDNTLNDIFSTVGGIPSKTQIDELTKVESQIQTEVDGASSIADKSAVLARYLIPLQKSGADRDAIIAQLRAAKDPAAIEALWKTLDAAFVDAKSDTSNGAPGQQARRDLPERRRVIADLLYNIRPENAWHARVQTVVGLNEYAAAADRQADRLAKAAERIRTAIADERTQFVKDYLSLVPELEMLSKELKRYDERSAEQKSLLNRATALKNTRTAEVAEFNTKIQDATRIAAAETAALQALQQRLFAVQKQLAAAQDENQKLERDIRAQETGK
jgi:chromosome segregation ATPase